MICHGVRWIPNLYEIQQGVLAREVQYVSSTRQDPRDQFQDSLVWPSWVGSVTQMSHLLTVLNSSVNFYIYQAKHYKRQSSAARRPNRSSVLSTQVLVLARELESTEMFR